MVRKRKCQRDRERDKNRVRDREKEKKREGGGERETEREIDRDRQTDRKRERGGRETVRRREAEGRSYYFVSCFSNYIPFLLFLVLCLCSSDLNNSFRCSVVFSATAVFTNSSI